MCVLSCHFFTRNKTVFAVVSGLLLLITMVISTVVSALMVLPVLMPAAVWVTVAVKKQYQTFIIQIIKICSTIITDCPYRQNEAYGRYYYGPPYTRYGQFLIGIVAGILLTTKTDRWLKKKVRTFYTNLCVNCLHACSCSSPLLLVLQWHAAIGWILCLTLLAAVSVLPYVLEEKPLHPSAPHALYSGTHRSLWALALTWIIVACEEGYGGKQQQSHQLNSKILWRSKLGFLIMPKIFVLTTIGTICYFFYLAAKSNRCNYLQLLVSLPITFYYYRFCQQVLVLGFLDPSVQNQFCQLLGSSSRHLSPPVAARQFN